MSGDGQLTILKINPGINKDITEYAAEGFWVSCDKVRFLDGRAEKFGGWVKEQAVQASVSGMTDLIGVARDIISWKTLDNKKLLAVGTNAKLQILEGGKYFDVTPIETSVSTSANFSTSAGSNLVVVSLNLHTRLVGDYLAIATLAATIGDNVSIGGDYQVVSIIDANSFMIEVPMTAAATSVEVGSDTTLDLYIHTGLVNNGFAYGWGAGVWSRDGWGEPSAAGVNVELSQWSLDNYGQNLLACRKGGKLYEWVASAGVQTRAQAISAAPSINDIILVNKTTRHVISFGCNDAIGQYDPLLVRWSDQEDVYNWAETVTNAAGSFPLQGGGRIVAVQPTNRETVILTNSIVHSMRYTGTESVFAFEPVGDQAPAISQHCAVDVNGTVYWMGLGAFYKYDGGVQTIDSTVDKYLFGTGSGSINFNQKEKVFAGVNSLFSEIIWLYPSRDSSENDSYVVYNYLFNTWYYGKLARTVWEDLSIFSKPYAVSPNGTLFIHENGKNDDASPMPVYLESGWFDIQDGTEMLFIDRFIPDIRRLADKSMTVTVKFRKYPQSSEIFTKGPYTITQNTSKISLRVRGRQAKIILEQSITNADFEVGDNRIAIQPDGRR